MSRHRHPREFRARAVAEVMAGCTIRSAAESFGVSYHTLRGWVEEAGVSLMPRGDAAAKAKALRLMASGKSAGSVAVELGFSQSTVSRWRAASRASASAETSDE